MPSEVLMDAPALFRESEVASRCRAHGVRRLDGGQQKGRG
jgi:hypothetical protein